MAVSKVLQRGQVTLPRDVRRAAGIEAGDLVTFRVTGHGKVELRVLPRLRLSEALERYRIVMPVGDGSDRAEWQGQAAKDVLGRR